MPFKDRVVKTLVKVRTSWLYVWCAIFAPITWVTLHRLGILHIDNFDMTYLNLSLSIMAEVQGVVLLIYTSKIMANQANMDQKRADLLTKMAQMAKIAEELEEEIKEVEHELQEE